MNYTDAVVDLETLGTDSDAVIVSIGVVAFDPNAEDTYDTLETEQFYYVPLDRQDQIDKGATVTAKTIDWWLEQDADARREFRHNNRDNAHALSFLSTWLKDRKVEHLWGNGVGFDNVILRNAYKRYGVPWPLHYRADMDMRTLKRLAGRVDGIEVGVEHHALDDAAYEALVIQRMLKRLERKI